MSGRRIAGSVALAWLALLVVSWIVPRGPAPTADPAAGDARVALETPRFDDEGEVEGTGARLSLLHWPPARPGAHPPVLLLHGSPGSARNFDALGPALARRGFDAWALDLPGFGRSEADVPSYSIVAHARYTIAALERLGFGRAHLVGWSLGGGVALHAADLAPERVASVALVASVGVQEAEGSGSHLFEHVKYAFLWLGLVAAPKLVPWLEREGGGAGRRAFVRNFWDTDQRPLRALLGRTRTPILVLHGAGDFLVPLWTARETHDLARNSSLIVVDGGHFLPLGGAIGQAEATAGHVAEFLVRHAESGSREPARVLDLRPARTGLAALEPEPFAATRFVPWWLVLAGLVALSTWRASSAAYAAGLAVASLQLDFGLAAIACGLTAGASGGRSPARIAGRAAGAVALVVAGASAGGLGAHLAAPHLPRTFAVLSVAALSLVAARAAGAFLERRRKVG